MLVSAVPDGDELGEQLTFWAFEREVALDVLHFLDQHGPRESKVFPIELGAGRCRPLSEKDGLFQEATVDRARVL